MKLAVPWDEIDALTLDVFDTAVLRHVPEPRDLFVLVEAVLVRTDGARFHDFAAARFEAELETMTTAWRVDRGADPGLAEIYATLSRIRPEWAGDAARLMTLECETELAVSRVSPAIRRLYEAALERGKAVAFLSDTYFPQAHMETLLRRCGYEGAHRVLASNVEGVNKVRGGMFDRAAEALGVDPGRIAHVGDNPRADEVSARARGFRPLLIPQGADLWKPPAAHLHRPAVSATPRAAGDLLHRGLLQADALIGHLDRPAPDRRTLLGRIGYSVFGPVLAGFVQWLAASVGEAPRRLHFVSRDGWLLKEAFEKYAQVHGTAAEPRYLYASRRSLVMATFTGGPEALRDLLAQLVFPIGRASLAQYCDFLGIAPPDAEELGRMCVASAETLLASDALRRKDNPLRQRIETFFEGRIDEIAARAARERGAYLDYLGQEGLLDGETVTLVDCGWFGTTQRHLKALVGETRPATAVRGYFLGTAEGANAKQPAGSTMTGYLYHEGYGVARPREFAEAARLLELFLKTDQRPFFYMQTDSEGGTEPVFGGECEADADLEHLQAEALRFVEDWLALVPAAGAAEAVLRPSALRAAVTEILEAPTAEQAQALGGIAYAADSFSDESLARFATPSLSTWAMLRCPDLRLKEVGASGSRRIYEMLSPSALSRLLVRLTPVDDRPVTPLHAFARRTKRRLKRVWQT